jgi:hypothetical protein
MICGSSCGWFTNGLPGPRPRLGMAKPCNQRWKVAGASVTPEQVQRIQRTTAMQKRFEQRCFVTITDFVYPQLGQ